MCFHYIRLYSFYSYFPIFSDLATEIWTRKIPCELLIGSFHPASPANLLDCMLLTSKIWECACFYMLHEITELKPYCCSLLTFIHYLRQSFQCFRKSFVPQAYIAIRVYALHRSALKQAVGHQFHFFLAWQIIFIQGWLV